MIAVNVKEYIQVGHRLINLPGKCQNIHGHSMLVTLFLKGDTNEDGYLVYETGEVADFSAIKKEFRSYLNDLYDHHLLLNENDPLVELGLPGVTAVPADPCVENICKWMFWDFQKELGSIVSAVTVQETATNGVRFSG